MPSERLPNSTLAVKCGAPRPLRTSQAVPCIVSVGDQGTLLVDNQIPEIRDRIDAALAELGSERVDFTIAELIEAGADLEAVVAAAPTAGFEDMEGDSTLFIDRAYHSLLRPAEESPGSRCGLPRLGVGWR